MIMAKKGVITLVATLHWRRMRAIRTVDDGIYQNAGYYGAIRVARNHIWRNHLFCHNNHPLCRAYTFNHDTEISPAVGVAVRVGALHVDDGHIRVQRPDSP